MIIFSISTYTVNSVILGWVCSTYGQTKEECAVVISIVISTSNVSFIWTPYLWADFDGTKRYTVALVSSAAFSFATAATTWLMKAILKKITRELEARKTKPRSSMLIDHS